MVLYNIEYRAFVLLICVGLLAIRPHQVCGSRKVVLGARNHHRMIKAIDHHMNSLSTDKKRASVASKKYDANQSSKRTVRRGSDPIHNRTWSRAMCIARQWKQRHTEETLHQCIKIGRSSLWKFGLVLDNSLFLGFLADVRFSLFFFFFVQNLYMMNLKVSCDNILTECWSSHIYSLYLFPSSRTLRVLVGWIFYND